MRRFASWLVAVVLVVPFVACQTAGKGAGEAAEPSGGPPLPLHTIEGVSGHFSVPCAYLANVPPEGEILGKPSVGATGVHLGHGKHLEAFTITEVLWDRIDVGYGLDILNQGDVYEDIGTATGIRPDGETIDLHNFNARFQVAKDGDFGQSWLPALTLGIHYKVNTSLDDLDRDLSPLGGVGLLGIEDDQGVDFTLFATKMIDVGRPLFLTLGIRSTEAAHLGLLGFTGTRTLNVEAAACYLLTDEIVLAAEYRQKPDEYDSIPDLVEGEDDWWVLAFAYLASDRLSVAVGYGHFGTLLNHEANNSWGIAVKFEF